MNKKYIVITCIVLITLSILFVTIRTNSSDLEQYTEYNENITNDVYSEEELEKIYNENFEPNIIIDF